MVSTQQKLNVKKWSIIALIIMFTGSLGAARIHFLHQSTGESWLADWTDDPDWGGGNLRADLEAAGHTVTDEWVDGTNAPYADWDPEHEGLCHFFLNDGAALSQDARNADILLIKSCFYPTHDLENDEVFNDWKSHSISDIVQGYFNNHPEKKLLYCSNVPHHKDSGDLPPADYRERARDWGEWLADRASGLRSYAVHGNVWGFDAFGLTARPETEPHPNTLKAKYEISYVDDHMNRQGNTDCADAIRTLVNEMTGIEERKREVLEKSSLKVSPNPGKGPVTISYSLPVACQTSLRIYDAAGKIVRTLVNRQRAKGIEHRVIWNGTNDQGMKVSSGIYLCQLKTERRQMTQKIMWVK